MVNDARTIAYFSMEVGLDPAMPTYSGGLGILSGDTLRAAADLGVPMVAVSLLHRKGYFRQHLDPRGVQTEEPYAWAPETLLEPEPATASLRLASEDVRFRAWRYEVRGVRGHIVPVYLLDTDLAANSAWARRLTDHLYGGDDRYRLCQEALLGMGGVAMLEALGHTGLQTYHMNEGHSALLAIALLERELGGQGLRAAGPSAIEAVRRRCVFTTHTPVPAGHDKFPADLVHQVLGEHCRDAMDATRCLLDGSLNMTYLALFFSHYVNGVSMRHEQISQRMFAEYTINAITNGVHAVTWTADPFRELFDRHMPQWRRDSLYLRYAVSIPLEEIQRAHARAKRELLAEVERRAGVRLDPAVFTIGFARRATPYKRADLVFTDVEELRRIAREAGPLQLVYGGKAHPRDTGGKGLIERIHEAARALAGDVPVVYLEEYDMALARVICAGVDLWLNTPQKPHEASGTSGMKAALNGVPSLSVLDGWWIEGHEEGVTGWSIGDGWDEAASDPAAEAASLYRKLEYVILPMFHARPERYAHIMRAAIGHNGSFFNAQRMVEQYRADAYQVSAPDGP